MTKVNNKWKESNQIEEFPKKIILQKWFKNKQHITISKTKELKMKCTSYWTLWRFNIIFGICVILPAVPANSEQYSQPWLFKDHDSGPQNQATCVSFKGEKSHICLTVSCLLAFCFAPIVFILVGKPRENRKKYPNPKMTETKVLKTLCYCEFYGKTVTV